MGRAGFAQPRLARMADVVRGHVERGAVTGVVTLLCRHDEVHVETSGMADLASGTPIRRDTIFRIASMTKPITAAAAMILVEETRLRLDDPVDHWLPELADRKVLRAIDGPLDDMVPARRPITLRDLLTFRLGLGAVMDSGRSPIQQAMAESGLAPGPNPPDLAPDELMQRFARLPLMRQPGERWLYHTGYDILAVLIARAAGMAFADFLAERIFAPLGMTDTAFSVPPGKLDRLAGCYRADEAGGGLVVCEEGRPAVTPGGSAGLVSTIDDYLAFGRMMLAGGRDGSGRILARPTVELMTTDQLTDAQKAISPFFPGFWDRHGWGFGVATVTRRDGIGPSPGSYGWDGGFGTSWRSDPHEGLIAILMTQRLYDWTVERIHADFQTLVYQAIDD